MATIAPSSDADREKRRMRHLKIHEERVEYHDRRKHAATLVGLLLITAVLCMFVLGIVNIQLMVVLMFLVGTLIGYCVHSFKVHTAKIDFHEKLADEFRGEH